MKIKNVLYLTALLIIAGAELKSQTVAPAQDRQIVRFDGDVKLQTQTANTVWTIDFVKTSDGQQTAFLKFIEQNWARARQTLKEKNQIVSYQVLSLPPGKTVEWDVLLITEYANETAHEKREELFAEVFKTQPTVLINGRDSKDMREIKFSRVFSQPISSEVGQIMLAAQMTNAEQAAARVPLENYLKAHETGDPEFMRKAFHTTGSLIFVRDGKYTTRSFAEYIGSMSGKPAPDEAARKRRIETVEVSGNAATGKIILDYPTVKFVDYMTLLKIDGEWKIVNKSFYAEPKPPLTQK